MPLTTPPAERSDRAFVTEYSAIVIDKAQVVLDERFENPSQRRTAIIELMLANHDEVAPQDVNEILDVYGGANADEAVIQVMALYASVGVDIDYRLGEYQRDVGPATIYTTLTDYGDGAMFIEHFPTAEDRLRDLRFRASNVDVIRPDDFFETADEDVCRAAIEYALLPTRGRIYLLEAKRHEHGEVYVGEKI